MTNAFRDKAGERECRGTDSMGIDSPLAQVQVPRVGGQPQLSAARKTDMDSLARVLARETQTKVLNRSALDGIFNFRLSWARDRANSVSGDDRPSLFTAIQDQLGLRLRSGKAPV